MASETPLLDRLNWLVPAATNPCIYEAAGWSCGSTGFLWFSDIRDGGERLYPCPRCNTELFLAKSHERASAERDGAECACCGQGLARLAYESALGEAQREMAKSPDPTRAAK